MYSKHISSGKGEYIYMNEKKVMTTKFIHICIEELRIIYKIILHNSI